MKTILRTNKAALAVVLAVLTFAALFMGTAAHAAGNIGIAKAKEIALGHAGFTAKEVKFVKAKLDDDAIAEYEIDFTKSGYRYEYDIDAASGSIREYSCKKQSVARNDGGKAFIGASKAREIALQHAGLTADQVTFVKEELDRGRISEYEVDFYTGSMRYEYEIDAQTGAVNEYTHKPVRTPATQSGATPQPTASAGRIGIDKAKEIALKHAGFTSGQVRFTKAKLDYDDGRAVYEIEFVKDRLEYEYEIDAETGRILDVDIDD